MKPPYVYDIYERSFERLKIIENKKMSSRKFKFCESGQKLIAHHYEWEPSLCCSIWGKKGIIKNIAVPVGKVLKENGIRDACSTADCCPL